MCYLNICILEFCTVVMGILELFPARFFHEFRINCRLAAPIGTVLQGARVQHTGIPW